MRSGDVIPQIKRNVNPKDVDLPDGCEWKGVDLITEDTTDSIPIKTLVSIFSKMDVKLMGIATVKRMYDNGLDTLPKILKCTVENLTTIGFGLKQSKNIVSNIHKTFFEEGIYLAEICGASGVLGYGIGSRRIELCFSSIPDFYMPQVDLHKKLLTIKGVSNSIADKITTYHSMMLALIGLLKSIDVVIKKSPSMTQKYVFSGFRDSELAKRFNVVDTVTKDVILVVKDKNVKATGKVKKAQQLGIRVITLDELKSI
jgi:NAD-dependent DNA ligase